MDKYRQIAIDKLYEIIKNKKKSKIIEKSGYDYTIRNAKKRNYTLDLENRLTRNIYKNKIQSLCVNLNKKSYVKNGNLLKKVKSNDINLNDIAFMKPREIFPENWEDNINKKKFRDEIEKNKSCGTRTSEYTCGYCKKNECEYNRIQKRSIDEPMATWVHCLNCHNEWYC